MAHQVHLPSQQIHKKNSLPFHMFTSSIMHYNNYVTYIEREWEIINIEEKNTINLDIYIL